MSKDDYDLERLPRWAQDVIRQLEASRDRWKEAATPPPDEGSDTFLRDWAETGFRYTPLGRGPRVIFRLAQHQEIEIYLIQRGKERVIEVRAMNGSIIVHPEASNSVSIWQQYR